jgi:hypothetical protein
MKRFSKDILTVPLFFASLMYFAMVSRKSDLVIFMVFVFFWWLLVVVGGLVVDEVGYPGR